MPFLQNVSITFNTHDDDKGATTILHVFVKNRLNTSLTPERNTDFIGNLLAFQRYQAGLNFGDDDANPYLASAVSLAELMVFDNGSSHTFDLTLRSNMLKLEDITLPVVNIHILAAGSDRWKFDYTITFTFDNGASFSSSSNTNGVTGIVLDQDNRNYSGICIENPLRTLPPIDKADTNAVLTKVTLEFATHNDDKNSDTQLNVHIVNRLNASSNQDIAIGMDLFHGETFPDSGDLPLRYKSFSWSAQSGSLASSSIRLQDIVLPVVNIIIQAGTDQWIFDYQVTFEFTDPQKNQGKPLIFSSRTNGVILDQDNNKHSGVYQGNPFPRFAPPSAPLLTLSPIQHISKPKTIPLSLLRAKLEEFINTRQGLNMPWDAPVNRVRLHNSGVYGVDSMGNYTLPESYFDLQSIMAVGEGVGYDSSPTSLGQIKGATFLDIGALYFNNINSKTITLTVDATQPVTPFTLQIVFDTSGPQETVGGIAGMNLTEFSITLKLTLDVAQTTDQFGAQRAYIDVLSWVAELEAFHQTIVPVLNPTQYVYSGTFLKQPVNVISTEGLTDFKVRLVDPVLHVIADGAALAGTFQKAIRAKIYQTLSTPDVITKRTPRDAINSTVNSWLLGGTVDEESNTDGNNNVVKSVGFSGDNIVITYDGPQNIFVPTPPADWPASANPVPPHDFSPGNLANIDHIVVLTMENRSFDHILGYLSLPLAQGGMGRTDVDGLKGGESNSLNGTSYPSVPLTDTYFRLDPPHGYEPVHQAINGGRMDGFVKSFAEAHGNDVAGEIMGHHTGSTVPVYDAMARDFGICHRWFASHPGSTFCNRFFGLTGWLNLDSRGFWEFDNSVPKRPVFSKTIFDYLSEYTDPATGQNVSWKYFEHSYCYLRFFESYTFDNTNIVNVNDPQFGFFACASAGLLPSVSFIDPHFIEYPPNGNCDGPPADVKDGQTLVAKVVEAVVSSPNWNKTLLIITYDEHGGFYDHFPPPPAAKVSDDSPITTYGVRVPAFVVSPWVKAGTVFGQETILPSPAGGGGRRPAQTLYFDHTSILKTIARRFMNKRPPYMGARYAAANDLSVVVGAQLQQPQFLPFIRYNLAFNASQRVLDVPGGLPTPGALLWQWDKNSTPAQDFSFEDAGNGFVYIRSHCGNLYVTVDVPDATTTTGTAPAASQGRGIKIDLRYIQSGVIATTSKVNPGLQKWKLNVTGAATNKNACTITNALFPTQVLQPVSLTQNGAQVVLGDPAPGTGAIDFRYVWHITSPLIADQSVLQP